MVATLRSAFEDVPTLVDALPPVPDDEREPTAQFSRRDQLGFGTLRASPLFAELPDQVLEDALVQRIARVQRMTRDELVPEGRWVVLVVRGQIATARFDAAVLREERAAARALADSDDGDRARKLERTRRERVGPLAARALENVAAFAAGELAERDAGQASFAITPAEVVLLDESRAILWTRVHPLFGARLRRARAAAHARLQAAEGARGAVADLVVRHGLSVSLTLRVRRLDACVECHACEDACEARYGVKRLSLAGRILGGLDFVDACHTCTDARCIDPCNFDAIHFDPVRKEVLIKEDACTGCTLCARACPYDAIEMHELDEQPRLAGRLDRERKLTFGEGTPRKARLRRIASKCDHCASYEDQACISACPTGALLELAPADVVPALPEVLQRAARAGFDQSVMIDLRRMNDPAALVDGPDVPELGRARAPRTRILNGLWWTLGLLAIALAGAEILLRRVWPAGSLAYLMDTRLDGIEPEVALLHVDYYAGCKLAVSLGWVGTALLVSSMAYVVRRRVLTHAGALRAWFDWHVVSSVTGSALIALHTAARLDNWISVPFWSMAGAVASGLVGRYLAIRLPSKAAELARVDDERRLAELRTRAPGVRAAVQWLERYRTGLAGERGPLRALAALVADDLGRGRRLRALARGLRRAMPGWRNRALRREVARTAARIALAERRAALVEPLQRVFLWWKAVHVPLATLLAVLGALHIVLALRSL